MHQRCVCGHYKERHAEGRHTPCKSCGCVRYREAPDGFAETRAQLDELAQQAEGSHRQHMEGSDG